MTDKVVIEGEVMEKCLLPNTEKKEVELEKNELGNKNSSSSNDKIVEKNSTNKKNDLSNVRNIKETLLSEGEASSGFETVSSVISNIDPDDFELSSTADEDDFNVVVEIENELAFERHKDSSERTFYWRDTRITDGYDKRSQDFSGDFTSKKHDDFRMVNKKPKYWKSSIKDKNFEHEYRENENRRDQKFNERKGLICNRRYGLQDRNWYRRGNNFRKYFSTRMNDYDFRLKHSRSTDYDSRPRRSRSSDRDSRTRYSPRCDYDNRGRDSEGSSEHDRPKRSRSRESDCRRKRSRSPENDCGRKRSRSSDGECTPKHSKSNERIRRSQTFRSSERNTRCFSPGYKDRKTGTRRSRSFGRNTPTRGDRDSPPRKRRRSFRSKSPASSVWKRLGGWTSSRVNSEKKSRTSRRKKERTPFLVELERKLKEADRLKESKKENINVPSVPPDILITDEPPVAEIPVPPIPAPNPVHPPLPRMPRMLPRITQNLIPPFRPPFTQPPPSIPRVGIPFQFTFPEKSVDNLPLVVGPTGLPVHVTLTGEHIPHDMEGRRIPLGPNGYYLPLDPTGRLFPHIVSPGNQAIPIHMTEDGVLRLPNSEPVPYGPSHKLPVDIDGIIIPIGPDSRPLFPCPNLPKQPPLNILGMIGAEPTLPPNIPQFIPEAPETVPDHPEIIVLPEPQQTESTEIPPLPEAVHNIPETLEIENREIAPPAELQQAENIEPSSKVDNVTAELPDRRNQGFVPAEEAQQPESDNQDKTYPPEIDSALVDIIQNPSEKINKADLLKNYKKKAREISEDILKCKEIEKNLGVNPSKGGVKRSIPMKFSKKKTSTKAPDKEDSNTTVTDMILESEDSDSTPDLKQKPKKGSVEEILLSSDEEHDILKIICDTETSKPPQRNEGAKPKDAIAKKVQLAIKSLRQRNYKPPVVGRFIISPHVDPVVVKSPNESPLLRNRLVLPFITPSATNPQPKDQSPAEEKTEITFKFLPQEVAQKGRKPSGAGKSGKSQEKSSNAAKIPVFTFDFAAQCDFTSAIIKNLNSKIAELEMEVVKLTNKNANLVDSYRNVQAASEKKSAELRKALVEIRERDREIQVLRSGLPKK